MKITRSQLRKIIREAVVSRGRNQTPDTSGFGPTPDDYQYEEFKIIFPKRGTPLREKWEEWFDSITPSMSNRFDAVAEVDYISYDYPDQKEGYNSAKIRVPAYNNNRFTMPRRDDSGVGKIKLVKRK
tara:strand:+ start:347 stop:727 length:381 start_codon:yes stop_codon:yes gene_type:complete